MLQGRLPAFRTTGFGIAVVAANGQLVGFGFGRPLARCSTAVAAELCAIATLLELTRFPPEIKIACLTILAAARWHRRDYGQL